MADKVEVLLDAKAVLGEGAIWHVQSQKLYWVDILQALVHIYDPATSKDRAVNVGQDVGTVVARKSGGLMLAVQKGFASYDLKAEKLTMVAEPEKDKALRFNDGKCDPKGRFWAGSYSYQNTPEAGTLYRLDTDLKAHAMVKGVSCSNGIVWSADKKTMYFIDTPTFRVDAFDYDDATGSISNRRPAVRCEKSDGYPDGMAIDAEGKLWIAHWGGNSVKRWDPVSGKMMRKIEIPATQVTSCAFGGPNLDQLYVTSATTGMDAAARAKYPLAGGLFRVDPGVKGVPSFEFAG